MFQPVVIYNLDGERIGFGLKAFEAPKLQSTNIWTEDEWEDLQVRLNELNDSAILQGVWPDARDPEVLALLTNESFEPLNKVEIEVIDEANSYIVYQKVDELDDLGHPTGNKIDGPDLDEKASVIRYTKAEAVLPSDAAVRTRKACEVVARSRVEKH